jgi:glyoxylase-like metal-dependent hydrolase (beta-lactamase superfamily II)
MDSPRQVADGIWMLRTVLVNVFFVRVDDGWMLVDAGIRGSAPAIRRAATRLFGAQPPRAIVLTHGHFDHVGALARLLETWDVQVYAHPFELPHLTGRLPYRSPDPTVGGGLLAWSSFLFPRGPSAFGSRLLALPPDGRVPIAPEWVALHTPGHTAGHVSLYRPSDGVVIAGDAVTTTQQESLIAVAMQRLDLNGPPAYFTSDWDAARWSVQRLAATRVETLLSGHGQPMTGESMRRDLRDLAEHFDERARPRRGRDVEDDGREAAFLERGWVRTATTIALAAAASALIARLLTDAGRMRRLSRAH